MSGISSLLAFVENAIQALSNYLFSAETATLAATVATVIAVHRYIYSRPELLVDVRVPQFYHHKNQSEGSVPVTTTMTFYIVNAGHRYAEDVQISLTADAFEFENDIEGTNAPSEDYTPKTTLLDIKSGRKAEYIGGGRRHDIYVDNPIYEGDVMPLYLGSAEFHSDGKHELRYTVACRSHGLREGSIEFEIDGEDSQIVTREYPTLYRRILSIFGWKPELKRVQRVENQGEVNLVYDESGGRIEPESENE